MVWGRGFKCRMMKAEGCFDNQRHRSSGWQHEAASAEMELCEVPAYNFQKQFVPMIEDGTKWHTIRKKRKRPTKSGDKLMLYTGQRTKACKLIKETVCTNVVPVKIYPLLMRILLDGKRLSLQEVVRFSVGDGFTNPSEFFDFFKRYSVMEREYELEVIYWR